MNEHPKDPLLQPFTLKSLRLKNRIFSASHEPHLAEANMPTERYRLYHEEKAKGGLALSMIGGSTTVAIDSPAVFGNIDASTDEVITHYQDLSNVLHKYDCAVMNQITHLGNRSTWAMGDWLPLVSASCVREPAYRMFPKEAEPEDIARIVKAYGRAALRSKEGGLDGVEVMAYGHLFASFLTPHENRRGDQYGGSLENRLRFGMEVLEEVRASVGDDYIVGLRIAVDEARRGGYDFDEGLEILARFIDTGLIDFLNVTVGVGASDETVSRIIPPMGTPSAPFLDTLCRVKQSFSIPVLHSAGVADVATARHAIASGAMDLVGMTRAHIADPYIVQRIEVSEEDRIRPCVGAGHCIDQIYTTGASYCLHNVVTGREANLNHKIEETKENKHKISIVGAGPAGLEAARVAALRGHDVTLYEAANRAGGQILTAAQAPRRSNLLGIVDWLVSEIERLGVKTRFGHFAEAADVMADEPDTVIIATGGIPHASNLESGEDLVVSTWDILNGHVEPANSVLIYDENGREAGPCCAEYLASKGSKVEIVVPDRMVGPDIGATNYPPLLCAMQEAGVILTTDWRLISVRMNGNKKIAKFYSDYTKQRVERDVEQVVVECATLPAADIFFDLKPSARNLGQVNIEALVRQEAQSSASEPHEGFQLFRIGDAVASRNIHAAMYEAHRLCVTL